MTTTVYGVEAATEKEAKLLEALRRLAVETKKEHQYIHFSPQPGCPVCEALNGAVLAAGWEG